MHYQRWAKHGDPGGPHRQRNPGPWIGSRGAWVIYEPRHPLANRRGQLALARAVAYKRNGPGEQQCTDCSTVLVWGPLLSVVHDDGNRTDCSPDNLVILCRSCHARRMVQLRRERSGT